MAVRESPGSILSNDIKFARIEVRTEKLWLLEVGVSELFFRVFSAKIPAKRGKLLANRELRLIAGVAVFLTHPGSRIKSLRVGRNSRTKAVVRGEKCIRFSACFPYFLSVFVRMVDVVPTSVFDVLGVIGKLALPSFLKFWICRKPSLGSRDMVSRTEATKVFLARRRTIFRSRFRLDRGKSQRSKSCTPCMNVSSFLKFWTCRSNCSESERIRVRAQHHREENYEIFSIVLFLLSVFACTVDVAPYVEFRRSWCRRKACATFFLKVLDLHKGELGFARYDLANRGYQSVFHVGGSFSDRDSGLIGEALDYSRVAHHS